MGDIFESEESGGDVSIISCFAEAFPEKEPNASKLHGQCHLSVDIVCERSEVRQKFHPLVVVIVVAVN